MTLQSAKGPKTDSCPSPTALKIDSQDLVSMKQNRSIAGETNTSKPVLSSFQQLWVQGALCGGHHSVCIRPIHKARLDRARCVPEEACLSSGLCTLKLVLEKVTKTSPHCCFLPPIPKQGFPHPAKTTEAAFSSVIYTPRALLHRDSSAGVCVWGGGWTASQKGCWNGFWIQEMLSLLKKKEKTPTWNLHPLLTWTHPSYSFKMHMQWLTCSQQAFVKWKRTANPYGGIQSKYGHSRLGRNIPCAISCSLQWAGAPGGYLQIFLKFNSAINDRRETYTKKGYRAFSLLRETQSVCGRISGEFSSADFNWFTLQGSKMGL